MKEIVNKNIEFSFIRYTSVVVTILNNCNCNGLYECYFLIYIILYCIFNQELQRSSRFRRFIFTYVLVT